MTRWGREQRAPGSLARLRSVPDEDLRAGAERVVSSGASASRLYERWEQQHWSVGELRIGDDRELWEGAPATSKEVLLRLLTSFYVGEFTAVDGLAAVMAGAPEEDELLFLATQSADEARHVVLMSEIDSALMDGKGGLRHRLPELWSQLTPAYRALQRIEDGFAEAVLRKPDLDGWLRLVSVFHLLTEGVMAINGQQAVIKTLRTQGVLPQVEAGFIGMMRDESRHIAYGTQAVRRWVGRGFEEHVIEAMEIAVPHVVHIDDRENSRNPVATRQLIRLVDRRLAAVGVSLEGREHIRAVASREYPIGTDQTPSAGPRPAEMDSEGGDHDA